MYTSCTTSTVWPLSLCEYVCKCELRAIWPAATCCAVGCQLLGDQSILLTELTLYNCRLMEWA